MTGGAIAGGYRTMNVFLGSLALMTKIAELGALFNQGDPPSDSGMASRSRRLVARNAVARCHRAMHEGTLDDIVVAGLTDRLSGNSGRIRERACDKCNGE